MDHLRVVRVEVCETVCDALCLFIANHEDSVWQLSILNGILRRTIRNGDRSLLLFRYSYEFPFSIHGETRQTPTPGGSAMPRKGRTWGWSSVLQTEASRMNL